VLASEVGEHAAKKKKIWSQFGSVNDTRAFDLYEKKKSWRGTSSKRSLTANINDCAVASHLSSE
jgi:hypothetical protein